jgi:transcriptional regulator with XRE-family HTH domain
MDLVRAQTDNPGMAANPSRHAGALLRQWRALRRMSQLDLALTTEISPRHLSCVETGKARPSRETIDRLAESLEIPLRERNALLVAAGFAPVYRESKLSSLDMKPVRQAVECIVQQQEPYPALVMNRYWDVLIANDASMRVLGTLMGRPSAHSNIIRQVFDPADVRSIIMNWEEVAGELIRHLHDEIASQPNDLQAKALLNEALAFPGVPAYWRSRKLDALPQPLLTTIFGNERVELRFFSTVTTFGTPRDITLDELRIECLFPADESTAAFCQELRV